MTLETFNSLPEEGQYRTVLSHGTFLKGFMEDQENYMLFAIDHFFVEIHFTAYKEDVIYIKAFNTSHLLHKYSPQLPN